jgi:DNA-binding response OmpR family regulator
VISTDLRSFQREYGFLQEAPSPPRVLLVDDDAELVALLVEGLGASRPALKVEAAYDAYEGILKVGTFRPHVLILNLRMPGMDGPRACRQIKENPSTQATKILVTTAHSEDAGPNGPLLIGADAFLIKPFTISRLKAEVRRLLKSAAAPLKMASEEADPQLAVPSA